MIDKWTQEMDLLRFVETTAMAAPDGLFAGRACLTSQDPEARSSTTLWEANPAGRREGGRLAKCTLHSARHNVMKGILLALAALAVSAALLRAFILLGLPGIPAGLISMGATVVALAVPVALMGAFMLLDLRKRPDNVPGRRRISPWLRKGDMTKNTGQRLLLNFKVFHPAFDYQPAFVQPIFRADFSGRTAI
jgi:hypothetical protein